MNFSRPWVVHGALPKRLEVLCQEAEAKFLLLADEKRFALWMK